MKTLIIILVSLFLLNSCLPMDDVSYCNPVFNNSKNDVYVIVTFTYPDTTIPSANSFTLLKIPTISKRGYCIAKPWEKAMNDLPKDTVCLFVFDIETITKLGVGELNWEEIQKKYLILKRKDINADVIRQNKKVEYP
jgi:hypothetical protein